MTNSPGALLRYPSQVTALSTPRVTSILTSELVLLAFEPYFNGIIQNVFMSDFFHYVCKFETFLNMVLIPFYFRIASYYKTITHFIYPLLVYIWVVSSLENYQVVLF